MIWRLALLLVAAAAALAPLPETAVERVYSEGLYPRLQDVLTGLSNRTHLALFDLCVAAIVVAWTVLGIRDLLAARHLGWGKRAFRVVRRTVVLASAIYLAFVVSWGFNYRRPSLGSTLGLDMRQATPAEAERLAHAVVDRLNALHRQAHALPGLERGAVDPALAAAFDAGHRLLRAGVPPRPARPKHTLLDQYFRTAGVDGFTAPFFAETLIPSDLLDVEWPAVVAHEWAHLAGYADEGEANFVAWLVCLQGDARIEYSGWLSIYGEALRALSREAQRQVIERLDAGPRDDLRALAARRDRNVNVAVARAGWRVYDQYLRANRVESGTASYGEVLRLVLGTELGRKTWHEALAHSNGVAGEKGSPLRSPS